MSDIVHELRGRAQNPITLWKFKDGETVTVSSLPKRDELLDRAADEIEALCKRLRAVDGESAKQPKEG